MTWRRNTAVWPKKASADVDDLSARMWMLLVTGTCYSSIGRWPQAQRALTEGMKLAYDLGDSRRWPESLLQLAIIALHQGEFARAVAQSKQVLAAARQRAEHQTISRALYLLAIGLIRQGQFPAGAASLTEATELDQSHAGKTQVLWIHGALSLAYWRLGRHESALRAAGIALEIMATSQSMANSCFEGIAGTAETYLEAWRTHAGRFP